MFVAVESFNVIHEEEITEISTGQTYRRGRTIMDVNHVHRTLVPGFDSADHVIHIKAGSH